MIDCGEDIKRRVVLAHAAFNKYEKLWLRKRILSQNTLLRLYKALVVPVLTYNCSSLAATSEDMKKLEVCQRRHLREILGYKWPVKITNEALYKLGNTNPISETVQEARWKIFGKILCLPTDSPAQMALKFAVVGAKNLKSRKGRHQTNLFEILRKEVEKIGKKSKNESDIVELQTIAKKESMDDNLENTAEEFINFKC